MGGDGPRTRWGEAGEVGEKADVLLVGEVPCGEHLDVLDWRSFNYLYTRYCLQPLSHHEACRRVETPFAFPFPTWQGTPTSIYQTTNAAPRACLTYRPKYEVDTREGRVLGEAEASELHSGGTWGTGQGLKRGREKE